MKTHQQGQALISLIVLSFVAITIITSIVLIAIISTGSIVLQKESVRGRVLAEGGIENALIYLLRNPTFEGDLSSGIPDVTINISGTDTKIILVTAQSGKNIKKVRAVATIIDNTLSVSDWEEVD